MSVRVELAVESGDLDGLRARLAELARDALAQDPAVVEVLHAATVVRRDRDDARRIESARLISWGPHPTGLGEIRQLDDPEE